MELGVSTTELGTYAFIGALFSVCVVFPPQEFHSAGFTIPKIFYFLLGDERFDFIEFHLRRTILTVFIHSALPFFFFVALELAVPQRIFSFHPHNFIQYSAAASLLAVIGFATVLFLLFRRDWQRHHIVQYLRNFDQNWKRVAREISDQMRAPIVYSIIYNAYSKVLVTTDWLIRVSNYNVLFAPISDSRFFVINSDNHPYLSNENNGIQLIDIRAESISNTFKPFCIRVDSQEMLDTLRDQLARPIEISESLVLPQPLHDRFVVEFMKVVESNRRYIYPDKKNLDPCLGCSSTLSEVKINKSCLDPLILDESERVCQQCNCRPMWCARCMGRIFASKQNQQTPEIWMAGRAPCPTCRAAFCVLDVCYLE